MEFAEKLMTLRKQAGLSQEQLADRLGVTRQSVSKWESGTAFPELVKLVTLSEMFGVSVDYLVKDYVEEPEQQRADSPDTARLEQKVDDLTRYVKGSFYAYDSQTKIFGLPLVSVRVGFVRRQQMSCENWMPWPATTTGTGDLTINTPVRPGFLACRWYPSDLAGTAIPPGTAWQWVSLPLGTFPWVSSAWD